MTVETIASVVTDSDCMVELDVKSSDYYYLVGLGSGLNSDLDKIGYGDASDSNSTIFKTLNGVSNNINYGSRLSNYYNLRFEKTGTTLKTYLNDTLIDTTNNAVISDFKHLNIVSWRTKTIRYKNLKIKPL